MFRDPLLFILVPIGALAFLLGLWGNVLDAPFWNSPTPFATFLRSVFRTVDLVRMGGALGGASGARWQTETARLLLPLIGLGIALRATILTFGRDTRAALVRRQRGHVVLAGLSDGAMTLATRLRAAGRKVVVVDAEPAADRQATLERAGATVLRGNAAAPDMLRQAGVAGAAHLVAALPDASANLEVAAAARVIPRSVPLPVTMVADDSPIWRRLQEDPLLVLADARVQPRFFSPAEAASRALLRLPAIADALAAPREARNAIAILGCGTTGLLLAETLASCNVAPEQAGTRVLLLDRAPPPEDRLVRLRMALPDVAFEVAAAEITEDGAVPGATVAALCEGGRPVLAVVALPREAQAVCAALDLRRMLDLRGFRDVPIAVRAAGSGATAGLLGECAAARGILPFGGTGNLFAPETVLEERQDAMARALHAAWLSSLPAGASRQPAQLPWEALPEWYRLVNRDAADFLGIALRAEGVALSREPFVRSVALGAEAARRVAMREHRRWLAVHRLHGWRHAPGARDVLARTHPLLVPWVELPEERRAGAARLMEREVVTLRAAGWKLVPLVAPPALSSTLRR